MPNRRILCPIKYGAFVLGIENMDIDAERETAQTL
jgi:hypothetical protein